MAFWIRSDRAAKIDWIQTLGVGIPRNGSVVVDRTLVERIKKNNDCLAITIKNDQKIKTPMVSVSSMDCYSKRSVVCSMKLSKFTKSAKLSRFPCIRKKFQSREKRELTYDTSHEKMEGKLRN